MKKRVIRILTSLFFVATFVLVAVGVLSLDQISDMLNATGLTTAFAAGTTEVYEGEGSDTEKTDSKSEDLNENTLSQKITKMNPSRYPLDTILREMGIVVPINSWETEWYNVDQRGIEDSLASGCDTTSDAEGTDPEVYTLNVNSGHIWSVDDTFIFQVFTGNSNTFVAPDGKEVAGQVVDKVDNTTIKVFLIQAPDGLTTKDWGSGVGVIPTGSKITRIGNAKAEKDMQNAPYNIYPQKRSNLAQIHMRQVEESTYQRLHQTEVPWGFADHKAQSLFDLRRSMEYTSLFGQKAEVPDPLRANNDIKRFSDGIIRNIDQALQWDSSGLNEATFVDWTRNTFTGNDGADTRIMFLGSEILGEMAKIDSVKKQIDGKSTMVKWGIEFKEIVTPFGRFLVKLHDGLNYAGWSKKGLILDVNNLEKHIFKQMETTELDLKGSGQRNVDANVIHEAFCVVTRYPDTHRIIEYL